MDVMSTVRHGPQLPLRHRRSPQTNGKAERFIQTLQNEWAYARPYRSNAERLVGPLLGEHVRVAAADHQRIAGRSKLPPRITSAGAPHRGRC